MCTYIHVYSLLSCVPVWVQASASPTSQHWSRRRMLKAQSCVAVNLPFARLLKPTRWANVFFHFLKSASYTEIIKGNAGWKANPPCPLNIALAPPSHGSCRIPSLVCPLLLCQHRGKHCIVCQITSPTLGIFYFPHLVQRNSTFSSCLFSLLLLLRAEISWPQFHSW